MNPYRWDPVSPVVGRRSAADLRASDAERHEVGDALARHFAEGRLDQAEFATRLDRALGAVTRGQLDTLFADLPPLDGPGRAPRRRRPRLVAGVLLVTFFLVASGTVASTSHLPWVLLVLGVLVVCHRSRRRHRASSAAVGPGR